MASATDLPSLTAFGERVLVRRRRVLLSAGVMVASLVGFNGAGFVALALLSLHHRAEPMAVLGLGSGGLFVAMIGAVSLVWPQRSRWAAVVAPERAWVPARWFVVWALAFTLQVGVSQLLGGSLALLLVAINVWVSRGARSDPERAMRYASRLRWLIPAAGPAEWALRCGRPEQALELLGPVKRPLISPQTVSVLARAWFATGRSNQAWAAALVLADRWPTASAAGLVGEGLLPEGEPALAASWLALATDLARRSPIQPPDRRRWQAALGLALARTGRAEEARRELDEAEAEAVVDAAMERYLAEAWALLAPAGGTPPSGA